MNHAYSNNATANGQLAISALLLERSLRQLMIGYKTSYGHQ